jgi:hypothetical protein
MFNILPELLAVGAFIMGLMGALPFHLSDGTKSGSML